MATYLPASAPQSMVWRGGQNPSSLPAHNLHLQGRHGLKVFPATLKDNGINRIHAGTPCFPWPDGGSAVGAPWDGGGTARGDLLGLWDSDRGFPAVRPRRPAPPGLGMLRR